ncbi:MAG: hypothetical protein FIB03_02000 [Anaerolineae bacterium]|nr:hypothetical protein [Anaerolineae bacterium]
MTDSTDQFDLSHQSVFARVLWLYGLYSLLNLSSYLIGYYLLPEGFMRGSPQAAVGKFVASATSFWSEFGLTLLFNLGMVVGLSILLNLQQVNGFPTGYILPITLGITTGFISGTNSFAASDLKQFNAWDGMALGMSIGGLEMLAYVLVIGATVGFGMYQYKSWTNWKSEKIKNFRDIRLSRSEILCLVLGIILLVFAAYRETVMAFQ